jgi:hypothetical protein
MAEYVASVQPSLGLNTTFLGGNYALHHGEPRIDTDAGTYGNFCVTRLGQAIKPGSLIVFISARFKDLGGFRPGLKPCKKSEGRRGQNRAKKAQLIVNGNLGILVGLHSKFPR